MVRVTDVPSRRWPDATRPISRFLLGAYVRRSGHLVIYRTLKGSGNQEPGVLFAAARRLLEASRRWSMINGCLAGTRPIPTPGLVIAYPFPFPYDYCRLQA
jgi:hypothetical protein